MGVSDILIPAKFISSMLVLIANAVINFQKDDYIISYFADALLIQSDQYSLAKQSIDACVYLTFICITFQFLIIYIGGTLFFDFSNFIIVSLYSIGAALYSTFIIEEWYYFELWYIWLACVLFPLSIDIFCSCVGLVVIGNPMQRRSSRKGN